MIRNVIPKALYAFLLLPIISIKRLLVSLYYRKGDFEFGKNTFTSVYNLNYWGSSDSSSGGGSEMDSTKEVRRLLPEVLTKFNITSIVDIPCGDFNWMSKINLSNIKYLGCDIVPELIKDNRKKYISKNIDFRVLDITKDKIPDYDLIFCKDCLQHLSNDNVLKALEKIKSSNSKYLLVTSYPFTIRNWDIKDGDYRPLNLALSPFNLPTKKAIYKVIEDYGVGVEIDKHMYLYRIDDII